MFPGLALITPHSALFTPHVTDNRSLLIGLFYCCIFVMQGIDGGRRVIPEGKSLEIDKMMYLLKLIIRSKTLLWEKKKNKIGQVIICLAAKGRNCITVYTESNLELSSFLNSCLEINSYSTLLK